MWLLKRDGKVLSKHKEHWLAGQELHRISSASNDWSIKYEGYSIEEAPEPEEKDKS